MKVTVPREDAPCIGCKDRFFDGERTCHSTCERYAAFLEKRAELRSKIHNEAKAECLCNDYAVNSYYKRNHTMKSER